MQGWTGSSFLPQGIHNQVKGIVRHLLILFYYHPKPLYSLLLLLLLLLLLSSRPDHSSLTIAPFNLTTTLIRALGTAVNDTRSEWLEHWPYSIVLWLMSIERKKIH